MVATSSNPPVAPAPTSEVLKATGINRGLCVVVGGNDAAHLVGLTNNGWLLVHGIALDEATTGKLRKALVETGIYGLVSVERVASFAALPYNANMVNLLVADCDVLGTKAPPDAEILRVIEPIHGVAYVKKAGQWTNRTKPMPEQMDEWPQFSHDASNNPVSKDALVGPMQGIQWTANVEGGSMNTIGISLANGRWVSSYTPGLPRENSTGERIDARDAFNGLLLWRRLTNVKDRTNHEASVVLDGRRVYGYVGGDQAARAWDATTGAEMAVYREAGSRSRQAPFYHALCDGVLLQTAGDRVYGIDTTSDKLLWAFTQTGAAKNCDAIAAEGGRVYLGFTHGGRPYLHYGHALEAIKTIVCLDLRSGRERWRTDDFQLPRTANFIAYKGTLVVEDYGTIQQRKGPTSCIKSVIVIDGQTGKLQRRIDLDPPILESFRGTFAIVNDFYEPMIGGKYVARNIFSGAEGGTYTTPNVNWCGYTRWTANGILPYACCYVDRATNKLFSNFTARSPCDLGRFPAYGLVYTGTSGCACIPMLRGFTSLHCVKSDWSPVNDKDRLEKGTGALGTVPAKGAWPKADEWPIFMANINRGSYTPGTVSAKLALKQLLKPTVCEPKSPIGVEWHDNRGLLGSTTPPTIANGMVLVAASDAHRLEAYDAHTGAARWSYTIGARIDSPPTIYGSLAIFGGNDGFVYALNATDGTLVWRYLARPRSAISWFPVRSSRCGRSQAAC